MCGISSKDLSYTPISKYNNTGSVHVYRYENVFSMVVQMSLTKGTQIHTSTTK